MRRRSRAANRALQAVRRANRAVGRAIDKSAAGASRMGRARAVDRNAERHVPGTRPATAARRPSRDRATRRAYPGFLAAATRSIAELDPTCARN
ncbi:hypothetical protein AQ922_21870 [Burkholderia pseudomallei]|nr:hypothetical protein AQ922_21870 [Burkholderia pseudomallei]